jgi:hypothetical protein
MIASSTIDAPRSPRARRLTESVPACELTRHNCSPCPEIVALSSLFFGTNGARLKLRTA